MMRGGVDTRDLFDAALIPGMRSRLQEAYAQFRERETEFVKALSPPEVGGTVGSYRQRDCPCCESTSLDLTPELRAHGMDLVRCPACGLVYARCVLDEISDAARYRDSVLDEHWIRLHDSDAYLELESARSRFYLNMLSKDGFVPGHLLEIGCSTGVFLREALRLGWNAFGIEPNQTAAQLARARGANVLQGSFPGDMATVTRCFDAVVALDVLEHFADPVEFLCAIHDHLLPTGRILIQVPNWDSLLVQLQASESTVVVPGHWSYFTSRTLTNLMARVDLHPLQVTTAVSEVDRIATFPRSEVEACVNRIRPGLSLAKGPLTATWLYEHGLAYKLIGMFAPA